MSTEIKKNSTDLRTFISGDAVKEQIAKALPSICTPDRFLRISMTAMTKTPKLLECDRDSFIACLLDCAQLGIEPDGRRAHLLPFNNRKENRVDCQLIIDYKGLIELAMRSGKIANIHSDKICDNDEFVYNAGKVEVHRPNFKEDRGVAYAYYAQVEFKDGSRKAEVMTVDEVNKIKARSKAGNFGPWKTDFDEMAKKTVFKRLSKWLPLSPEDVQVIQKVDEKEFSSFDMPEQEAPEVKTTKEDVIAAFATAADKADLESKWEIVKESGFSDHQDVREAYLDKMGKLNK